MPKPDSLTAESWWWTKNLIRLKTKLTWWKSTPPPPANMLAKLNAYFQDQGTKPSPCVGPPFWGTPPPGHHPSSFLCSLMAQQPPCSHRDFRTILPLQNCPRLRTQFCQTLHCPLWLLHWSPRWPYDYKYHATLQVPGNLPWPNRQMPGYSQCFWY